MRDNLDHFDPDANHGSNKDRKDLIVLIQKFAPEHISKVLEELYASRVTCASSYAGDMQVVFENGECSDVQVDVNGCIFKLHKVWSLLQCPTSHQVVLVNRCPYFHGVLLSGLKESGSALVKLDADPNIARLVLLYLYTGTPDYSNIDADNIISLFILSQKLLVSDLSSSLEAMIVQSIDTDNAAYLAEVGEQYGAKELQEACKPFLIAKQM